MADQAEGLGSLFFYMLVVYPATSWILTPGRFRKDRGIVYAILFLAAIAFGKLALEFSDRGPNYYQTLGVPRGSSALEIKKAYRGISLELHPDKNPSQDAADRFSVMKSAYDVLMDSEKREIYNKFGPSAVESNKVFDEYHVLMEVAVFYVMWGVVSFMLTLGKSSRSARDWIFTGQILMLVVEVTILTTPGEGVLPKWLLPSMAEYEHIWIFTILMLVVEVTTLTTPGEGVLPKWLLPSMADYEVIGVLHSIFPAFMNGCRSLGGHLYVDTDKQTREMLLALQAGHQDVLMVMRDIQANLNSLAANGGRAMGAAAGGSSGARALPVRMTPTGKLRELQEKMNRQKTGVDAVAEQIKESGKSSSGLQWIIVAVWIAFYFFMSD